jgi:hypothetical protein
MRAAMSFESIRPILIIINKKGGNKRCGANNFSKA